MSGDFDDVFGRGDPRPNFTRRVARGDASVGDQEEFVGSTQYKPFGFLPAGGIGESCDVQRWPAGSHVPEGIEFQYRFLMQIGYVGEEELKLYLPDCIVVIEGKNLRELRKKLARRQVTFIQQFSASVWPNLPPEGEAIVERVTIARPEKLGA